jgi:hypothetical protein
MILVAAHPKMLGDPASLGKRMVSPAAFSRSGMIQKETGLLRRTL